MPNEIDPKVKILLVDSEPANLDALQAILAELEVHFVRAGSGDEALRLLQENKFAVVLLDVQPPGLDGFATAKRIRSEEREGFTPIIFTTACRVEPHQLEEAYSLGAVDYLVKPILPAILKAKVSGLVELFKQNEQVQRQTEQLRLLVHGTTDYAIFMLDPQGHVLSWNAGAERIKGYREEEIVGQHFSRFYPPEAVERGWPDYELKMASKEGRFEDEGWRVRKDGSQFWTSVIITALRDKQGRLRGFSKITRDLTARKQAEETARRLLQEQTARAVAEEAERKVRASDEALRQSEERLRAIISQATAGIWQTDLAGRFVFANQKFCDILGCSAAELRDKTIADILHPDDRSHGLPLFQQATTEGKEFVLEIRCLRNNGMPVWVNNSVTVLRDRSGRPEGILAVTLDVTERRRAEQEVKEADRRKDEFLATLAHELRNPLAPIKNSVQVMRLRGMSDPELRWARDIIERQVEQMSRLVDDLLDISRISRGKVELRKRVVDLADTVARAVETTRPLLDERRHTLTVTLPPEPVRLEADPTRLEQILGNLLNNSAKYTEPGGQVWLTAQREGLEVAIQVRDSGIGISPELLPRIFDMFVQADHAQDRAKGGLGIGLSLVRSLVEMHQGAISVRSEGVGKGSEFTVRLPALVGVNGFDVAAPARGQISATSRRFLVVDDNVDSADTLAVLLRLAGHDVQVAHDGRAALEAVQARPPEIVFLDIGLPGMNGYEVARRIRQMQGGEQMILLALTGWGQEDDRRRTREAGFDHHLIKPLQLNALERVLSDHPCPPK